jgi:hypothetical protein
MWRRMERSPELFGRQLEVNQLGDIPAERPNNPREQGYQATNLEVRFLLVRQFQVVERQWDFQE